MKTEYDAKIETIQEQQVKATKTNSGEVDDEDQSSDEEEVELPSEVPENLIEVNTDGAIKINRVSKLQFINEIESRSRAGVQVDPIYGVAVFREKSEIDQENEKGSSRFQLLKRGEAYD